MEIATFHVFYLYRLLPSTLILPADTFYAVQTHFSALDFLLHHTLSCWSDTDPLDRYTKERLDKVDVLLAVFWQFVKGGGLFDRCFPTWQGDVGDFDLPKDVQVGCEIYMGGSLAHIHSEKRGRRKRVMVREKKAYQGIQGSPFRPQDISSQP